MLIAPRAELLELDPLRVESLVLRRMVVSLLALGARENDVVAGHVAASVVLESGAWN
jgi:hypothetical protein